MDDTHETLFLFLFFLQLHLQHMEVSRLEVEWEMQLQAYATTTATVDLRRICNLCCSLRQRWLLNPLSEAKDRTCILRETMLGF